MLKKWTVNKLKEQLKKDFLAATATAKVPICTREKAAKYFEVLLEGTLHSAKELFKEEENE